jgi:RHS repeat-associated protein
VTADDTTTYAWDYENQLIKVVTPDGTVTEFAYDPFGRRIVKKVTVNSASTTTHYFYDNGNILFDYDDAGTIGNRYTDGTATDEHLRVDTGKGKYYYHADGLGSIIAVTDTAGIVVQTYQYDAFGNLKDQKNRVKQPYAYTGREWDKETGLYYYRARYYDPMEGRFISKDPIGFDGGLNLYNYTDSNPVNKIDPFGLRPPAMDPGPLGGNFTTTASYAWDPNDNGSFTNAYCTVVSKVISICLDRASVEAALTKSLPGFAIYGLSIANGAVSMTICPGGASPSTATTLAGGLTKPKWFGPVNAVVDAVLTALGH